MNCGEGKSVIHAFRILVRSFFALALLLNAGGSLAQTLPGKNNDVASIQDKKRLERF